VSLGKVLRKGREAIHKASRPGALTQRLHQFLEEDQIRDARERQEQTRDGWLHVSEAVGLCPRMRILGHFLPKPEAQKITVSARQTFDMGHAWHKWVQERYLARMGILKGKWKCIACGYNWFGKSQPECPGCNRKGTIQFREVPVSNEEHEIQGRADGIIELFGTDYVLDIKTINEWGFMRLAEPSKEHIAQITLYMGFLRIQRGILWYFCKPPDGLKDLGALRGRPTKEFWVEFDPEVRDEVLSRVAFYKKVWKEKRLPTQRMSGPQDPACRWCAWKKECYAIESQEELEGMAKNWSAA